MLTMSVSSGALAFLLMLVIFRNSIIRESVKKTRIEGVKFKSRYIDEELELSLIERLIKPTIKKIQAQLKKMNKPARKTRVTKQTGPSPMEKSLRLAGLRMLPSEFMMLRIIVTAGFLLLGFILAAVFAKTSEIQVVVVMFVFTVGFAMPTLVLRSMVKSRQEKIQNQLPTVMDILSVSIEAGLGFDSAVLKVVERYEGPLIDELALMYREIQMGKPRREAMNAMAQRSSVSELQTFVTAVVQADQFGTPIKNVLRNQAIQLRISRRQQAQEKGMKAPVQMVVPMVLFIFPVMFIVLLGPTVISAMEQFG